jgi:lysophospholipase L1-like esterase
VPISAEFIAEVELARHISFEEAPTVLPGHVYAHLYTKYQGGASAETVQILEVIAGVDYKHTCVNSMDSPLDADGTVNDIPNLSDADIRRMSTLHKFYDVVTSASLPKPGDKISVQYTDSNPSTSGVIISHVASAIAVQAPALAGGYNYAGATTSVGNIAENTEVLTCKGTNSKPKEIKKPKIIVAVGDSLTAHCTHNHSNGAAAARLCGWTSALNKKLKSETELTKISNRVIKLGYSGESTSHLVNSSGRNSKKNHLQISGKTSKGGLPLAITLGATHIIFFAGINDIASGRSGASGKNTIAILKKAYEQIRASGAAAIGVTLTPWYGYKVKKQIVSGPLAEKWHSAWVNINNFIRNTQLLDCYVDAAQAFTDNSAPKNLPPRVLSKYVKNDKLHLNDKGAQRLGNLVYDTLFGGTKT